MKDYRIITLYSGSGGNAIYLESAGNAILIDAGKNARTLCRALTEIGSEPEKISAVFITHEHSDHVAALEVFEKKYRIPVHVMTPSAERFARLPMSALHECLVCHDTMFCETVGGFTVSSFRTPHDSRMSVGYRISFGEGDRCHTVGIATDIGYVSDSVKEGLLGCEAVVIEANHDVEMLMKGPYPYDLKKRILSKRGHLCNADSAALMTELAESGTRGFLLAHLSAENNDPALALDEAQSALSGYGVCVRVAAPDIPTELAVYEGEEDDWC